MAIKKIMETFFTGMQNQTYSGYSSKIVNTPMGPFSWNDTLNAWVNTNNGMALSNISFQDSILMDYATYDGGGDNSSIIFGTIPMVFQPTSYNITNNYEDGSRVTITPSIVVPATQANFDIKYLTFGNYIGGTLSSINIQRNRNGTIIDGSALVENTNWPPIPGNNLQAGDILTFSVQANSRQSIGTEEYNLYWYDQSGNTLSAGFTISVNIPANPFIYWNPNELWNNLTGLTLPGNTYSANSRFGGMNTPVFMTITEIKDSPLNPSLAGILYTVPQTAGFTEYIGGFTWGNASTLPGGNFGISVVTPSGSGSVGSGILRVTNVTDSNRVIQDIPYSFNIP